jgi:hypothetical protein
MTDREIEDLQRRLKKRGFNLDGMREHCADCNERAQLVYRIAGRTGGRDIRWCLACGKIRSWKRSADDILQEEVPFDVEKFLA